MTDNNYISMDDFFKGLDANIQKVMLNAEPVEPTQAQRKREQYKRGEMDFLEGQPCVFSNPAYVAGYNCMKD